MLSQLISANEFQNLNKETKKRARRGKSKIVVEDEAQENRNQKKKKSMEEVGCDEEDWADGEDGANATVAVAAAVSQELL